MFLQWDDLPGLFPSFPTPGRWLPLLVRHLDLLEAARDRARSTAVSPEDAVRRNYAESLEILRIAEEAGGGPFPSLADVGSGGGYPGLVIAIVRPGSAVHLVEPLQKRARLLEEMALALGLANVTVHPLRAEQAGRGPLRDSFSLVTARAVAELRELLEYTAPLAQPFGLLAIPKGSALDQERARAAHAMSELAVDPSAVVPMRPEISDLLRVSLFRKHHPTDSRYPRRPGLPGKRPL